MLTSTALVLMMTIPGLALFYGGMVRKKNVLATLMQSFAITCLVTVLWVIAGYSLAFMPGGSFIGSLDRLFLNGMLFQKDAGKVTVSHLATTIPESVYMMFQMTFAIITPALICGAFADRMKFSAMLWFMGIWSIVGLLADRAHDVGTLGVWAAAKGVLDFAGGTVVHINAGIAGLVCALVLGKRIGYGKEAMTPHNLTLTVIGASLLWVGWFGFNAGSAVAADGRAGMAMAVTQLATAVAALAWMFTEWMVEGQALGAGHRLGRRRRSGRDHAGVGFRRNHRRLRHRHRRGRALLFRGDLGQEGVRLRRFARRLRRALHRRYRRRAAHRRLQRQGNQRRGREHDGAGEERC